LTALFIQLIFFSLGVLIAVISNRIRSVVTISISTVMAFFIASMVSNVIKEDKLRYFIPFQYFNFNEIIKSGGYDMLYVYLSLGIFAVFTAFSFFLFQRKDIHAV
jgi:ABC-2 type transport system permease protein